MRHTVRLDRGPQKLLDSLHGDIYTRIVSACRALAENPRPPGVRKLKGYRDYWRIRVGDYRILYTIQDDRLLVIVIRIGHRWDVYD
ncbi:MAG: type II toxin-antitoxin system RelE/ParE family toxin [Lentisphaerae bacterium]|nr:type II toxin-antitoxin system RelE/ParE family toxin [Lentisphaerota bacterium]